MVVDFMGMDGYVEFICVRRRLYISREISKEGTEALNRTIKAALTPKMRHIQHPVLGAYTEAR